MKESTRKWIADLAVRSNNSKAVEISKYIDFLENEVLRLSGENPSDYESVETSLSSRLFNGGR